MAIWLNKYNLNKYEISQGTSFQVSFNMQRSRNRTAIIVTTVLYGYCCINETAFKIIKIFGAEVFQFGTKYLPLLSADQKPFSRNNFPSVKLYSAKNKFLKITGGAFLTFLCFSANFSAYSAITATAFELRSICKRRYQHQESNSRYRYRSVITNPVITRHA